MSFLDVPIIKIISALSLWSLAPGPQCGLEHNSKKTIELENFFKFCSGVLIKKNIFRINFHLKFPLFQAYNLVSNALRNSGTRIGSN